MSVLAILFWLLIAAVLVVTAALVLPVGLRIEAMCDGPVRWRVDLQPFGRFGPRFRLPKPKADKPKVRKKASKRSGKRLRHPGRFANALFRLASDVISTIRLRRLSVDAKFGCADPADTGQIYGLISPFLYGGNGLQRVHLTAEPVFDETVFEGRAMLELAIVPISLLPPVIRFGWALYGPLK